MSDKVIVARTPLEKAALKAAFVAAERDWFGTFTENVQRFLYQELGLEDDDDGAQLDIGELSDLMVKWARSVNYG